MQKGTLDPFSGMQTLKVLLMVCHEKSKIVQMFQNDLIFVYVKIYIDLSVNA